jgi:hypothetical protein
MAASRRLGGVEAHEKLGVLRMSSLTAGSEGKLIPKERAPSALASDGVCVYWTQVGQNTSDGGPPTGSIRAMTIPR